MLVARWLRYEVGGLAPMAARNAAKAALLYAAIDQSDGFYRGRAKHADRSLMNVVFNLPTPTLDRQFLHEAEQARLFGLDGHRTLGGIRASLYNAVTLESVEVLVAFMRAFQQRALAGALAHVLP